MPIINVLEMTTLIQTDLFCSLVLLKSDGDHRLQSASICRIFTLKILVKGNLSPNVSLKDYVGPQKGNAQDSKFNLKWSRLDCTAVQFGCSLYKHSYSAQTHVNLEVRP